MDLLFRDYLRQVITDYQVTAMYANDWAGGGDIFLQWERDFISIEQRLQVISSGYTNSGERPSGTAVFWDWCLQYRNNGFCKIGKQ